MPSVYEIITKRIVKQLEQGVIPWKQPWSSYKCGIRWDVQEPYKGINLWLLPPGEYATKKVILQSGGRIKYDELKKYHPVVYWIWIKEEDKDTGEIKKVAFPKYYQVWEINSQVTGLESKRKNETFEHNPIEEAEKIIKGFVNGPTLNFNPGTAAYYPTRDHVSVPPLIAYKNPNEYYNTIFHELVHSTGHKSRLNRSGITALAKFGSEIYSKEELVAELGASMLCGVAKIDNTTIENSAAYIQGWLDELKGDQRLITIAAAQAQKAADHILAIKYEESSVFSLRNNKY
ncbi:ArdC family protein [Peribacillus loiseleuriae]|uniref:ArdC family protein n=1 Tax=Peribacillus loiseleuriae TaxID=1679170 RepID=UPI003D03929A